MEFLEFYNDDGFHEIARYPLDPSSVGMKSLSKDKIVLKYTGELPVECSGMNPRLIITPKIAKRPSIQLVFEDRAEDMPPDEPWEEASFMVEATAAEIMDLMDRFGKQRRKNTGMDSKAFCELYFDRYMPWRELVRTPWEMLDIIDDMSPENIAYIAKKLQSRAE